MTRIEKTSSGTYPEQNQPPEFKLQPVDVRANSGSAARAIRKMRREQIAMLRKLRGIDFEHHFQLDPHRRNVVRAARRYLQQNPNGTLQQQPGLATQLNALFGTKLFAQR
jgi:hypothetical protein